jgi:3-hydroxyisobutyrate dehydrogenase-like beta-hydroxyacid dehydrogenase
MTENIGIIGLGRVGLLVAKAYMRAGYQVFGCDQQSEAARELESSGGTHLSTPEEVAKNTQVIILLVLNDDQVVSVTTGQHGILSGIRKGTTIICMSTINRSTLEAVAAQCEEQGAGFIDAPFTGGPARVADGSLTLIVAAPSEFYQAIRPILEVIGKPVHVGESPGLGQAVKHCNQLLVGVTHAATMEVITLARKLGLDPEVVTKVIGSGIAGSDYFRLLSESVLTGKPSPGGLGQMCKDVAIVVNTTREVKMPAYVASSAAQYFHLAKIWKMQDREGADLIEVVERVSEDG